MLRPVLLMFSVSFLFWAFNGYYTQKSPKPKTPGGIWISVEDIRKCPASGPAWRTIKSRADSDFGKAKGGHNDNHDVFTYAQALVAVKLDDPAYRKKVVVNIMSAIGSEDNGNVLALCRNLLCYVIAADLIDFEKFDPENEAKFRKWLTRVRHKRFRQGSLVSIQEKRPNNFGTHATAARAAAALYLGDKAELERTAKIFKGWLGDRTSHAKFKFRDLSWQADASRPVGINPKDATKHGHSIDGVLPADQRRGGGFSWPPPKENYVYGALQGACAAAHILNRAGYDAWNWQDKAILRAYLWLYNEAKFPAKGDDRWQMPLVDFIYGTHFWDGKPVAHGKNMGWTDWTHGQRKASQKKSAPSGKGASPSGNGAGKAKDAPGPTLWCVLSVEKKSVSNNAPMSGPRTLKEIFRRYL